MDTEKLVALLSEAGDALEQGDFASARAKTEEAKGLDPAAPEVILLDVELALHEAEDDASLEAALEVLGKAADDAPDDPILAAHVGAYLIEILDDHPDAVVYLDRAAKLLEDNPPEDDPELTEEHRSFLVDVLVLLSEARSVCLDPRGALEAAEKAAELDPELPEAQLALAAGRFDLCDLAGARTALERTSKLEPAIADAHWLLGRVETVEGNEEAADRAFQAAAELDGEGFHLPTRIAEDDMVALLEKGIGELPDRIRRYMENVSIVVEDFPELARLREDDPPLSPGSLGMFEGTSPAHEATLDPFAHYPKQITLFRKNLEIEAADAEELGDLVMTTLIHEIGHFLGLDEEDLHERGLD